MPKKKIRPYGDYVMKIDGKDYAVVRLPLGNGKYKRKMILLEKIGGNKTEAAKWAWNELDNHKKGDFNKSEALLWTLDRAANWYKKEFLIAPVYENNYKVDRVKDYERLKKKLDKLVEFFGAKLITLEMSSFLTC